MDLLERYLNAVRFWLPAKQEDDIIAELRDDIRAEIGDRESDLGRTLTEADLTTILARRGDPMLLAGRYVDNRPLVDAGYLPVYWFVVKLVTLWILVPVFVLILGPIEAARTTNVGLAWVQTVWNLLMAQVFAFGVITLVFVSIDRSPGVNRAIARSASDWDPRQLPVLPSSTPRTKAIPRSSSIAEIVANMIVALIWAAVFWGPQGIHLNSVDIFAAPIWTYMRWLVLIVCFASIAAGWFGLVRPYSIRAFDGIKLGIELSNFAILVGLLLANRWIELASTSFSPVALASAENWSNSGIRIGLGVATLITGYHVVNRLLSVSRGASPRTTHVTPNITV